jgi:hypothetical protein
MLQEQYARAQWSHSKLLQQFKFQLFVFTFHVSGALGSCCIKGYYPQEHNPNGPTAAKGWFLAVGEQRDLSTRYNFLGIWEFAAPTLKFAAEQ